jgi:hypothetical protein
MDLTVMLWRAALAIVVSLLVVLVFGVGWWLATVVVLTALGAINRASKRGAAARPGLER